MIRIEFEGHVEDVLDEIARFLTYNTNHGRAAPSIPVAEPADHGAEDDSRIIGGPVESPPPTPDIDPDDPHTQGAEWRGYPLSEVISSRARNAMAKVGVRCLGHVVNWSPRALEKLPGVSTKTTKELRRQLRDAGVMSWQNDDYKDADGNIVDSREVFEQNEAAVSAEAGPAEDATATEEPEDDDDFWGEGDNPPPASEVGQLAQDVDEEVGDEEPVVDDAIAPPADVTPDELRAALTAVAATDGLGPAAVKEMMANLGFKSPTSIPEPQWGRVVQICQELIANVGNDG